MAAADADGYGDQPLARPWEGPWVRAGTAGAEVVVGPVPGAGW